MKRETLGLVVAAVSAPPTGCDGSARTCDYCRWKMEGDGGGGGRNREGGGGGVGSRWNRSCGGRCWRGKGVRGGGVMGRDLGRGHGEKERTATEAVVACRETCG